MKIILKVKCLYCEYRVVELMDKAVIHTCLKHQKIVDVFEECADFKGR